MKTRILLVNFGEKEQEAISKLGVDADLGYLSNAYTAVAHDGSQEQGASFYSPYAVYDYKAIFIRLTDKPPLEAKLKDKAQIIGEKEKVTFLRYWYDRKGIFGIFAGESDFNSLIPLGIPHATLCDSRGNDRTVFYALKTDGRPLRSVLEEVESLIVVPPPKYVEIEQHESKNSQRNWTIYSAYENRNDEEIGVYLNWGYSFSDEDTPAFLILPPYKDYPEVITKLLKVYARIYPKYFEEISDQEWTKNDKYYPKEISLIDDEIRQLTKETEGKIKVLQVKKAQLRQEYSYLRDLLTESGDKLKAAVIKTLTDVFKLQAKDADESKKTDLREDIVIQDSFFPTILAEVKGTKSSCPSFTYVSQVFSNLLKERGKYPDAVGGLILNLDRDKEPSERSDAYAKADEEKQLTEMVYIDTRDLFDLSMAVIDHKMPVAEAKNILLQKGRVKFGLSKYLKQTEEGRSEKK